jgi:hypothetical protein
MPTMVGLKDSKDPEITIKYVCTDCAWVYYIENPKIGSVAAHEHKTALAWYLKHSCLDSNVTAPEIKEPLQRSVGSIPGQHRTSSSPGSRAPPSRGAGFPDSARSRLSWRAG